MPPRFSPSLLVNHLKPSAAPHFRSSSALERTPRRTSPLPTTASRWQSTSAGSSAEEDARAAVRVRIPSRLDPSGGPVPSPIIHPTRDAEAFIRQSQHLYATGSRAPKPVTPTVASLARSFYFTQVIPELNARERAFCDRYFSSYLTLLHHPKIPLPISKIARIKNAYGARTLDAVRIIYKCTTAANQPTGVMLLAERLWASGVGVELLEGEEVEDKVRELLKVNVAVDWFDVQREDLETLLEYFKKEVAKGPSANLER